MLTESYSNKNKNKINIPPLSLINLSKTSSSFNSFLETQLSKRFISKTYRPKTRNIKMIEKSKNRSKWYYPKFINLNNDNLFNALEKLPLEQRTFYTNTYDINNFNNSSQSTKIKTPKLKDNYLMRIIPKKNRVINLDIQIANVQKNKNNINKIKTEENIKKFNEKEEKLKKIQFEIHRNKSNKLHQINKITNMRRLKLKIQNILNNEMIHMCSTFESKMSNFNNKMFDFLSGKQNINANKEYHKQFRFDKNELGEAHDRFNLLLDVDSIKNYEIVPDKILKKNLNNYEKKLINEDPEYFFGQKDVSFLFRHKTLIQKIYEEENDLESLKELNKKLISQKFINSERKNLKQKLNNRIRTDINKKLDDIKNDLNYNMYKEHSKFLNKLQIPNKMDPKKIFNKMNKDLMNSLAKNNLINIKGKKDLDIYKVPGIDSITTKYDLIERLKNEREFKEKIKKEKERKLSNIFNEENNEDNNFNKNENDFLNKIKQEIKDNYNT